jgi:hypothetical protein
MKRSVSVALKVVASSAVLASSLAGIPTASATTACKLTAELVPTCGVILGAYSSSASNFGGTNVDAQFNNFNAKSGTTISLGHDYRAPGQTLSPGDAALAKTHGALVLVNWKPVTKWVNADGGDATVNAQIDAMARSVKALGTTKIMMTLHHEPEIAVSGGAAGCPSTIYKGSAGTPAQYRAMWSNVEARFAALGVTNVVWAIDFVGWKGWECLIDQMWPGNSLIDWVLWDPYEPDKADFSVAVSDFYNILTTLSDATHDYLSKPWGLAEFGDLNTSDAVQNAFYSTIAQALNTNEFPKLKLLTAWNSVGHLGNSEIDYDMSGKYDAAELANFDALGRNPLIVEGRESVDGG